MPTVPAVCLLVGGGPITSQLPLGALSAGRICTLRHTRVSVSLLMNGLRGSIWSVSASCVKVCKTKRWLKWPDSMRIITRMPAVITSQSAQKG